MLMVRLFYLFGNWRLPLILGASLGFGWCLAVWPWLRDRPEQMPRVNPAELALIEAGRAERKRASHHRAPWSAILRTRTERR